MGRAALGSRSIPPSAGEGESPRPGGGPVGRLGRPGAGRASSRPGLRRFVLLLLLLPAPLARPLSAGWAAAGDLPAAGAEADSLFQGLADSSWVSVEPPRRFGPENLYEEIDGEAELYLPYGFRDLRVAILSRGEGGAVRARVEVFRHRSARDAYGVYSQHRFPGQETAAVGSSEAIVSDGSVDFFRGEVFVRIRQGSQAASRRDLLHLAAAVSGLLGGTGDPPAEARLLDIPALGTAPAVYQRRAVLGHESLAPGFESTFSASGVAGRLLLLEVREGESAAARIDRLAGTLPGFARLEGGLFRADLPGGTLWLLASGGRVGGAAGRMTREEAERVLEELRRRLGGGGAGTGTGGGS